MQRMLPRSSTDTDNRQWQINSLKVFNANVLEIMENMEYAIRFQIGQRDLTLHIYLNQDFPIRKPLFFITPIVKHSWVNPEGEVVAAPGLVNFTSLSDLGRVAQAVIREISRSAPETINDCEYNLGRLTPFSEENGIQSSPKANYSGIPTKMVLRSHSYLPLAELSKMSIEELRLVDESVEQQEVLVATIPQIKEMNQHIDALIHQNLDIVESNLSYENRIEELKLEVDQCIEKVTNLTLETERLSGTYQNLGAEYSPSNIKRLLTAAAEASNVKCDEIVETFLRRDMTVDSFVQDFVQNRILFQSRKMKEEKLTEQLRFVDKGKF